MHHLVSVHKCTLHANRPGYGTSISAMGYLDRAMLEFPLSQRTAPA